jgi:hypothetical protein
MDIQNKQLKKFHDYFQENFIPLINKISQLRSSHYSNVSTGPPWNCLRIPWHPWEPLP